MSFEKMPGAEQPKSLLDALKEEISAAEGDLKSHYKKGGESDGYDIYKEGKEKSTDLLAMRKAAKSLEAASGDVEAAMSALDEELEKGEMANPEVAKRARTLLERKSQSN